MVTSTALNTAYKYPNSWVLFLMNGGKGHSLSTDISEHHEGSGLIKCDTSCMFSVGLMAVAGEQTFVLLV